MENITSLGLTVHLQADFDTARQRAIDALKAEGFGVLTEIDVKATMKNKLDVDFRPYSILGACNPSLAHRALSAAPEVGLLLPCNVTVSSEGDGTQVSAVNPLQMLGIVQNETLEAVATEAYERLNRAMQRLAETSA
jgi:uncharacterized protein (DUF302 family)